MLLGAVIAYLGSLLLLSNNHDWALVAIVTVLAGLLEVLRAERGVPVTVEFIESRLRIEPDGTVLYLYGGQWIVLHPERVE
jgi:hypothetical protein